jgi:hypothetical protein
VRGPGPDCRKLDDQIAFVIAVAIDPNAALAELPGELAEDTKPEVELLHDLETNPPHPALPLQPVTTRHAPPATGSQTRHDIEWHFGGSLGPAGGLGALPDASIGLGAAFSVWTGTWSHHLRATYWFPQRQAIGGGAEVQFGMPELALFTCPELWAGSGFQLAGCAGVTLAHLTADPRGFLGKSQARWLAGPLLSVRLAHQVAGPLAVVLAVAGEGLWPRHRIDYDLSGQPQTIWEMPPAAGRADLSLELRF